MSTKPSLRCNAPVKQLFGTDHKITGDPAALGTAALSEVATVLVEAGAR